VIGQEGVVVTSIDAIEVASEDQDKLLESMARQAKAARPVRSVR
jgi:hypothetical protein